MESRKIINNAKTFSLHEFDKLRAMKFVRLIYRASWI